MAIPFAAATVVALAAPEIRADVLVYAADADGFREDVRSKIAAENLDALGQIDVVDARSVLLTAELLADYDAVLTWGNQVYEDSFATGDALADFSDAGGGVVVCAFGTVDSGYVGINGRFVDGGYLATSQGEHAPEVPLSMVIDDPGHRIMDGVAVFDGGADSGHAADLVPVADAAVVASWSNGDPLVVVHEPAGRSVVVDVFPISDDAWGGGWLAETDGGRMLANALWWSIGAECGDGFAETPEACDDGNDDDTDACVACENAECGDGVTQLGAEACDDGNRDDDDDCRNDCTMPTTSTGSESGANDASGGAAETGSASSDGDDGSSGSGATSAGSTSAGSTTTGDDDGTGDGAATEAQAPGGCGCRSGADPRGWCLVALCLLPFLRRRTET